MFDNISEFVKDDLKQEIRSGSKVSIAAACFSIYAYRELRAQLEQIEELRFIFTWEPFIIMDGLELKKRKCRNWGTITCWWRFILP